MNSFWGSEINLILHQMESYNLTNPHDGIKDIFHIDISGITTNIFSSNMLAFIRYCVLCEWILDTTPDEGKHGTAENV